MIRILAFLTGLLFVASLVAAVVTTSLKNEVNEMYAFHEPPEPLALPSDGAMGRFDRQQLQRGLQVYREVCAACHGLRLVAFRDIAALGYDEEQVKNFAKEYAVPALNPDTGEADTREGVPSDYFPAPYPNEIAARAANNNALPPDLSLITKARIGGADYIYSLLVGYQEPPADLPESLQPSTGLYYNPYFSNLNIAMAPPLADGQVDYADGTEATVTQMAEDVSAFLVWTAEPKLENRLRIGWATLIFLSIFLVLCYMSYRAVWTHIKQDTE